jgi:hypothetical protein
MDNDARILADLQLAIDRLADAVADHPDVAGSLRRFAAALPEAGPPPSPAPRDPTAIRGLL